MDLRIPEFDLDASAASGKHLPVERRKMVSAAILEPEGDCQDASVAVGESRYAGFDTGWTGRESASQSCTAEVEHSEKEVKMLVQGQAETAAAERIVVD